MAIPSILKPQMGSVQSPVLAPMGAPAPVPIPYANMAQNAGATSKPALMQAAQVQQKQIAYNPKLNPKYDAKANNASAGSTSMAVDPRAGAGQSLIGKDLAAAISPAATPAGAAAKPAGK
ncbi:MAG: hypothetical protein KF757_04850 [Phycisphaeraceae bacterium]|nr:hypothetical protein [Phycisphaeraceae bacterium]MCW5763905.1 hypothetical protein [Phycisphaeraceae bacterium]